MEPQSQHCEVRYGTMCGGRWPHAGASADVPNDSVSALSEHGVTIAIMSVNPLGCLQKRAYPHTRFVGRECPSFMVGVCVCVSVCVVGSALSVLRSSVTCPAKALVRSSSLDHPHALQLRAVGAYVCACTYTQMVCWRTDTVHDTGATPTRTVTVTVTVTPVQYPVD